MLVAKFKKIMILALLSLSIVLLSKILYDGVFINAQSTIAKNVVVELPADGDQVNVKDFGAKGDGITDDTSAIQKAVDSVIRDFEDKSTRDFRTVYFPEGVYLVSDTIQIGRIKTIQGANKNKTIIRLKDNLPEYSESPKPLLRSMFNNNQTFAVYVRDLTVDTGKGNSQAIGIQYNTHNIGAIENVIIRSDDLSGAIGLDLSESEFGPGMITRLTVQGFDIGIKTPGAPSNAVFSHITLKQQNLVGLENNMPVSIEKLESENKVPAIHNSSHPLAHLVLINANLLGLPGADQPNVAAIETSGPYYLRQIKAEGNYVSALKDNDKLISSKQISESWSHLSKELPPGNKGHLKLAIKEPPLPYIEPVDNWVIPDSSQEDDTLAIQAAMNSGAKTIFFPGNITYQISDTIEVPVNVRRIVAQHSGIQGTETFVSKPMLRLVGNSSKPITIEGLSVGTWSIDVITFEVASDRPIYFKYSNSPGIKNTIKTNDDWAGEIFMDEYLGDLELHGSGSMWVRQWNPENNPFKLGKSNPKVTYALNDGAKLWVLGIKTEAPAIHVQTQNGGQTELLGGFFRDHFSPNEYNPEVPYLITKNASVSASYLQYAWAAGKARKLQAIEIQNSHSKKIVTPPDLVTVELYQSSI